MSHDRVTLTGNDRLASALTFHSYKPAGKRRVKCEHVLATVDFSPRSRRALDYAVSLAERLRAKVSLLHVVVPESHPLTEPVRQLRLPKLAADARTKLDRLRAVLRRRGVDSDLVVFVGLPVEQITSAAREMQTDLLVLTTHGRTSLKRLPAGSTCELVLQHAPCPVLVVRDGAGGVLQ